MNAVIVPPTSYDTRLHWVDIMRFIAMFMMIMSHAADTFNFGDFQDIELVRWWGAFWGSALRPCVPLFVMMTGVLLLPLKEKEMSLFYQKRIPRVLYPFLVWSILYNLFPWIVGLLGGGAKEVNLIFPYATDVSTTLSSAVKMCAEVPLTFTGFTTHMWYVYLLIGLYLFMPIFSAWVERATKREKEIVLGIWGITLFLPYVTEYTGMQLWGSCSWNSFPMLYYFGGFSGYLLLGHYLATYNQMQWRKSLIIGISCFVVGYFITFKGFRHIYFQCGMDNPKIELFWTFCSINVALETIGVFIIIQKLKIKAQWINKLLADMAKYGYGVYMCHYFIVGAVTIVLNYCPIPIGMRLPIVAIFAYFISYYLIKGIGMLPKNKYIIG